MAQRSAAEVLAQIQKEAEEANPELRFVRTCGEGDEVRQGDLYLYPLDEEPSHESQALNSLKLASGDSPGSRHIVVGKALAYDRLQRQTALDGPVLLAQERVVLTHPEHAHVSLPAGWYEVRYQRDYAAGPLRIPRRVVD